MTLADLVVLYCTGGALSSVAAYRVSPERGRSAWMSAALALPLWPLWLPVVLSARRATHKPPTQQNETQAAIWEAHETVRGSPLEPLLPHDAAVRMVLEVERATERHSELVALLSQQELSCATASERVSKLEREGAGNRSLAPARLHLENVRRLEALRQRDQQTLLELRELVTALRTQLILARYAGSSAEDAGDIVNEVWARVEVLGSTLEAPLESSGPSEPHHGIEQARALGG